MPSNHIITPRPPHNLGVAKRKRMAAERHRILADALDAQAEALEAAEAER